jgi:GNAT superfamily N-acetyltransferase
MYVDDVLSGEIYSCKISDILSAEGEEIPGVECEKYADSYYLYSIGILDKFQGKGLGRILQAYYMGLLKGKGIKTLFAHSGASRPLSEGFGGKLIKSYKDWYKTGKTYYLFKFEL